MARITTEEIMKKLQEIENLIRLDKFITLGYFIVSIGVAIVSIGYFIENNEFTIFGFLLCFSGVQSFLIYYMLKTGKEIKWKKRR